MSKEQENTMLQAINKELEEKTSKLQGLSNEVQKARTFIQQNEPNLYALDGAIQQLKLLKGKLEENNQKENDYSEKAINL